jgi:F0F1-type ATP synthase membrane subunit a
MIPFSLTITSYILITLIFSLTTFVGINILGYLYNGRHFIKIYLPAGIPSGISLILILIEAVSYIAKVLSLSIRLFANMMSGHTLLKILIAFLWGITSTWVLSSTF